MFLTRPWARLGALAAVFVTVSVVSMACGTKEEPTPQETPTATAGPTNTPVPTAPTTTPTVPHSPTVAPEPKSATVNLSGTWESQDYQCPFGTYNLEIIQIQHTNGQIIAKKVTGDPCVPAENVTFQGIVSKDQNSVAFTVGTPADPAWNSVDVKLTLIDENAFYTLHTLFLRRGEGLPLEDVDLTGTWESFEYQCPLGTYHSQIIRIKHVDDRLSAENITGDPCVPAGNITFEGTVVRNQGSVEFVLGSPAIPASFRSEPRPLIVITPDVFHVGHFTFFRRLLPLPLEEVAGAEVRLGPTQVSRPTS